MQHALPVTKHARGHLSGARCLSRLVSSTLAEPKKAKKITKKILTAAQQIPGGQQKEVHVELPRTGHLNFRNKRHACERRLPLASSSVGSMASSRSQTPSTMSSRGMLLTAQRSRRTSLCKQQEGLIFQFLGLLIFFGIFYPNQNPPDRGQSRKIRF